MHAERFLEREGYRRCDRPACNCGSWHREAEPIPAKQRGEIEKERLEIEKERLQASLTEVLSLFDEDAEKGRIHVECHNEVLERARFLLKVT